MNSITVSAKTVNDAITEASIQLGIASTGIDYEVIEEGSAGFLGIGRKQAVIRAWKKVEEIKIEDIKEEIKIKDIRLDDVKVERAPKAPKKEKTERPKTDKSKSEKPHKAKEHKKEVKETKAVEAPVKEFKTPEVIAKEEKLVEVTEETKAACETFLKDVLNTMGMEVKLTSKIDEDGALSIEMEGDNMGILIGKR